ncbi:ThiF family adenylyltransferase [Candidatus Margulisiibacteriota bacterium]
MINKPIILLEPAFNKEDLSRLKTENQIFQLHDIYEFQLQELFEITHPQLLLKKDFSQKKKEFFDDKLGASPDLKGAWVYFPWSGKLVHMLNMADYQILRTNRNRDLITIDEQKKLKNFSCAIAGLSIGSNIALGLVHQGISHSIKLADIDLIQTSNLNRIRAKLTDIGLPKTEFICQSIYEVNPFAEIKYYFDGINTENIDDFVSGSPQPKVIFDEIDDFEMKVRLRIKAKEARIPVIMFANVDNKIIIDIERFDLDEDLKFFNGELGAIPAEILSFKNISEPMKHNLAVRFVGENNVSPKAQASVSEIGSTLVGRPQLNSTVTVSSGLAVYFIKRLALGEYLPSSRKVVDLDELLIGSNISQQIKSYIY